MAYMRDVTGVRLDTIKVPDAATTQTKNRVVPRTYGPHFEHLGQIITAAATGLTQTATGQPSIYIPQLYDMSVDPSWPSNRPRFLILYSTDHDSGLGGIGIATADDIEGPWTPHKPGGSPWIFRDLAEGAQTETPVMRYVPEDPDGKPHYCYYSQALSSGRQATILARTADPLNPTSWERVGKVIDTISGGPGDGQTTYATLWSYGASIAAYTIDGGGTHAGGKVLWTSVDGIRFHRVSNRMAERSDLTGTPDFRFVMGSCFLWRNEWHVMVTRSPWGSGLWTSADTRPHVAKVSSDFLTITSAPVPVFPGNVLPAGMTQVSGLSIPLEADGYLYAITRVDGAAGSIHLFRAEA